MIFTKSLWPPFPRPYWPQCQCGEQATLDAARRLVCATCSQLAERMLPARLKTGKDACAAIDKAERLMGQLAVLEFTAALGADGALVFCDLTGKQRDFAGLCPPAHAFSVLMAALDVDPSYLGPAPEIAVKRDRKRELKSYREPAPAPTLQPTPADAVAAVRFWHVCPTCGLAGPVDTPGASYCRIVSHAAAP
jgi:hypothetical protein